jgi:alpha-tubulin suppressor-like RCC1 family protein
MLAFVYGCDSNEIVSDDAIAPELKLSTLAESRSIYSSIYAIDGTVSDNEGVESLILKVNDVIQDISFTTTDFNADLTLAPGINNYELTATDEAGNITSIIDSIYFGQRVSGGGAHSGAIVDGQTWTWGRNNFGQTGLGFVSKIATDENHPTTPQKLEVLDDDELVTFVSLAFNQNASIALDNEGDVWSWGDGDGGQLGLGEIDSTVLDVDYYTPQKISSLKDIVSITRGYDHTVALDINGDVFTFGENDKGQLGNNSNEDSDYPNLVSLSNIVQIVAASDSTYAIDSDGILWGWGDNSNGELGQGASDTDEYLVPTQISLPEAVTSVAAGKAHVLALGESGKVYGWGLNASNQIGNTEEDTWEGNIYDPVELPWITKAIAVWANGNQSFVQKDDGLIYPWGFNGTGTLGLETDEDPISPTVAITDLTGVLDIGVGALHTISLRNDGLIFSWGWSFEGSLGIDDPINFWGYSLPQKVEFN